MISDHKKAVQKGAAKYTAADLERHSKSDPKVRKKLKEGAKPSDGKVPDELPVDYPALKKLAFKVAAKKGDDLEVDLPDLKTETLKEYLKGDQ